MWPKEIRKVLARIIKQDTNSNRGTQKPNLGNLFFFEPNRCTIFFCPTLKKLILSSYQNVTAILLNHLQVMVSNVQYRLGSEIR
jgi:hypothetical protein